MSASKPFSERTWMILPDGSRFGGPAVVEVLGDDDYGRLNYGDQHALWGFGIWGPVGSVGTLKAEVAATLRPPKNKRERQMIADLIANLDRSMQSQAALAAAMGIGREAKKPEEKRR